MADASGSLEEIPVYGRKQGRAEQLQTVPLAVSAFTGQQLEQRFARDLQSLSHSMPNVALDDVGTAKGVANFSIRGVGVNSSIPSIDPTVGVFVDGVYLGINGGVVLDFFDLDGIEVLRGPQGLLFGRNVTGGAVLMRTRAPSDEFGANLKVSTTDRLDRVIAGSITGPLVGEKLSARLTGYVDDDRGWFDNKHDGDDFGASKTVFMRPSLSWKPTEASRVIVRYERGDLHGDMAAAQNRRLFSAKTFDVDLDEDGFNKSQWDQASAELTVDVPFGDGTVTNLAAWREYDASTRSDVDASPDPLYHSSSLTEQDQWSNELRYAGRFFDRVRLTTGLYLFHQDLRYFENRRLRPIGGTASDSTLGGEQGQYTLGVFGQTDIDLTSSLVLNLGLRSSRERKHAVIATLNTAASACNFKGKTCSNYDFRDTDRWADLTPRLGLEWKVTEDALLYGFWTKGFRSGGYNLRSTSLAQPPGPTDQEEQNSFEIGGKADWFDGRLRTNVAAFYNRIEDMQREVNLADPGVAVLQIIRNTADASIRGVEAEVEWLVTPGLRLSAQYGYVDGRYDHVRFDLNGDGRVTGADYNLHIPRLAPLTWGVGLTHDLGINDGWELTSSIRFNHRDAAAYTDNNLGKLSAFNALDASLSLVSRDGKWRLSIFGRNLLDEVSEGGETILPPNFGGGTFAPLNKGRQIGVDVSRRFQ